MVSTESGLSEDAAVEPRYAHNKVQHWKIVGNHEWGYLLGNATKYVYRCRYKGSFDQDLVKATRYIQEYATQRHDGIAYRTWIPTKMSDGEMSDLNWIEKAIIQKINDLSSSPISMVDTLATQARWLIEEYREHPEHREINSGSIVQRRGSGL